MEKSIVTKGKTVQEALQIALEQLDVTEEEVTVEVIEEGRRNLFGLTKRTVAVKVTVTGNKSMESLENTVPTERSSMKEKDKANAKDDLQGKAWVADGIIYCKDTSGSPPLIKPSNGLKVYVNEELITEVVPIKEEDTLRVELEDEIVEPTWSIEIDENGEYVQLDVKSGYRLVRTLIDQGPAPILELLTEETKSSYGHISKEAILQRLNELKITYGIDEDVLSLACNSYEDNTFIIAKAKAPVEGKHGWIEYKIEVEQKEKQVIEKQDGTVDFRESNYIPTVEEGTIIGIVHPEIRGIPGKDVFGKEIAAPPTLPLIVRAGKGTSFQENEKKVVATLGGKPQSQQQGQMLRTEVIPKLQLNGNVDISVGNIRFKGDVEISGDINEGMTVEAEGVVIVRNNVSSATLSAGNSIYVSKNVINSSLTAGNRNMIIAELSQDLHDLKEQWEQIIKATDQLSNNHRHEEMTGLSIQGILNLLLDQKYSTFIPKVKEITEKIKGSDASLDKEWFAFAGLLKQSFLQLNNQFQSLEDLVSVARKISFLYSICSIPPEPNARITIEYALNSKLSCSGDIHITGKGCYHSSVYAGGTLIIEGVLIGENVFAEAGIKVNTIGSKVGAQTKVMVPQGQKIEVQHAYEDTMLQIGKYTHLIREEKKDFIAMLDENHQFVFQK